jgi:hypothetical protein
VAYVNESRELNREFSFMKNGPEGCGTPTSRLAFSRHVTRKIDVPQGTNHESRITVRDLRSHAACLSNFAAVIGREHFHGAAHFVEAGTDAHAQAVRE